MTLSELRGLPCPQLAAHLMESLRLESRLTSLVWTPLETEPVPATGRAELLLTFPRTCPSKITKGAVRCKPLLALKQLSGDITCLVQLHVSQ